MAGHKTNEKITINICNARKKLRKIYIRAIGVDILSKERYLLDARGNQLPALGYDGRAVAATLSASHIRYYTVRAEIVASIHYGHPSLVPAGTRCGHPLYNVALILSKNEATLMLQKSAAYKLGNTVKHTRLGSECDVMKVALELVRYMRLSRHTAHNANYTVWVGTLNCLEATEGGEGLHFCVLSDGAGVNNNKITALIRRRR